jgi:hypothetical protein
VEQVGQVGQQVLGEQLVQQQVLGEALREEVEAQALVVVV